MYRTLIIASIIICAVLHDRAFGLRPRSHRNIAKMPRDGLEICPPYPELVPLVDNGVVVPEIEKALQDMDEFLEQQQKALGLPGLVCSVVYDQDMIFGKGYGTSDPFNATASPPTIDSIVRIASITKVFTALFLYVARDAGVVDLDDPVNYYLPSFRVKERYATDRQITLKNLASQSSGLQREIPCEWDQLANCTEEEILNNLAQLYVVWPRYYKPHYSNLGFALLGRALEKAVGELYEDFVQEYILKPIGMNSSTFYYTKYVQDHLAVGVIDTPSGVQPAPIEDLGWGNPMGGLFASSRDMSAFMSFMFRTNSTPNDWGQILDGSTINEVLMPAIEEREDDGAFGNPWEWQYVYPYWVKAKAGELNGYRSQVALIPALKLGVFCSGTADDDDSTSSMLTIPILEMLIPAFNDALWARQPIPPLPPNINAFLGLYQYNDPVFGPSLFEVYLNGSVMFAAFTDGTSAFSAMNLTQIDDTSFQAFSIGQSACRWMDDGQDAEIVYFTMAPNGKYCTSVNFMATPYQFVSQNCPQC